MSKIVDEVMDWKAAGRGVALARVADLRGSGPRDPGERFDRLRVEGVDESSLERLMARIGLDLGAGTPEERAVAIMVEIIAPTADRSVRSSRDQSEPSHRPIP